MILPLLLAACLIDDTKSTTPTLAWSDPATCPCTMAPCSKIEGYRLSWSQGASGPWVEFVRLPCASAFDELQDDGSVNHSPRWCWGINRSVPISRWVPSTPGATQIYVRVEALSATGALSCPPGAVLPVCWPLIRELP